jgi:hypothetical protein
MKQQLLLSILLTILTSVGQAQSWTADDWQGTSYDIDDYTDKAVVVDLSAHWCPPCWSWHQTGIMEELYYDFGPEGTNEFMVFFIDGDPGSSVSQILGGGDSQGNWTIGTEYPIIGPSGNGQSVASNYNFDGYPTLFLHCGAGTADEISRDSKWNFWDDVMTMCSGAFDNKANDATLLRVEGERYICDGGETDFAVEVYNAGTTTLTSFDIQIKNPSGTLLHTENFTGMYITHGDYEMVNVYYPASTLGTWKAKVVKPNGFTDTRPNGDEEEVELVEAPIGYSVNLTVEIVPDDWLSEINWDLIDPNGVVILSSPPYSDGTSSVPPANVTATENGCFTFNIYDSYGDGICCSEGYGSYKVKSGGVTLVDGGEFSFFATHSIKLEDPDFPLPVELVNFEVKPIGCEVLLEWTTSSEMNNEKFIVERSSNGKDFVSIGTVAGQGTSIENTRYSFIDRHPYSFNYYRLRQVDFDGKEQVSTTSFASRTCGESLDVQILPNLISQESTIQFVGGNDDELGLQVLSVHGKIVQEIKQVHRNEYSSTSLNVSSLPEGIYYLRVQSHNNQYVEMMSFVVSR